MTWKPQIWVSQGVVWVCVLLVLAIIARRLATRSAWLVQVYHSPRGAFLIPNAVMSLAICILM